jgi:DNA polymerase-3 subunit beta
MLLEVKNRELVAVASDGHRLALAKMPIELPESDKVRVIIPRKGILELQRLLSENSADITICIGSNHIRVITPQISLTSKLLEGRYPDYERIIPQGGTKVVTGHRDILKDAFHRASSLFSDKFRAVRLRLSEGCLKVLATTPEQDEVEEDIEVDYQGHDLEIGFNVKYLLDLLTAIHSESVAFTFSDSESSAKVSGVGGEQGTYVIMPMRI